MRRLRRLAAALVLLPLVARVARAGDETKPPFSVADTNAARYALDAARGLLRAGEAARGMAEIQRILDSYRDDLVLVADDGRVETRWISAPEAALRILESATPEQLKTYEDVAAPAGATLLRRAEADRDEALLSEVISRYGASTVGVSAARRLAESALESGRARDAAAAALRGLRFAPSDAGLWLRRIDALDLAGDADALGRLVLPANAPAEAGTAAGPVRLADRLAAARAHVKPAPRGTDWPAWGGGAAHDARFSADHTVKPLRWTGGERLRGRSNDEPPPQLQRDQSQQRFVGRFEMAAPYFPALVDRTLVVADGVSVEALDLYTGRRAWAYPGEGRPIPDFPLVGLGEYGEIHELHGRTNLDAAYAPSVDGGRVYATVEVEAPYRPRHLTYVEITTYLPRRDLVALDAKTGTLVWRMGQDERDRAALRGVSIAGPVAVAEGLVAAVGVSQDNRWAVCLLVFDATTGRLRWKRTVVEGQQELNLFGQPVKELYAGAPAISGGVVYAPTGLGVFAAADLRSGELLWVASYDATEIERVDLWYLTPLRFCFWGPSPPVVFGDTVLVAPADSPWLLCLDRKDGRLRWRERAERDWKDAQTAPSMDMDQFLGVAHDGRRAVALATGRGLRALDLSNGKHVWRADVGEGADSVHGRGAISQDTVYVPTDRGLSRFKLSAEGKFMGDEPWPQGASPGNVLPFPEVLVVAGRGGFEGGRRGAIQGFFAWEDLEKALSARRLAHPGDPAVTLEAADLWRVVGEFGRADELYREALRLATSQGAAGAKGRARYGLHLVEKARAEAESEAHRPNEARKAYEAALAFADAPSDRVATRLRLDQALRSPADAAARLSNLDALAREAGDERAVFDEKEGEVSARAGARLRIATIHREAGRLVEAVDALQAALVGSGDLPYGEETVRAKVKREIEAILSKAGPAPYAKHEADARARLLEADRGHDAAAYESILELYPNAGAIPAALLGLAEKHSAAGESARATATLRRLISAYPEHPLAPKGLAALAKALFAMGSRDAGRAALSTLERRHPDAKFDLGGASWTGRSFAEAERVRVGAPPPIAPEAPLSPPVKEARMIEVDPEAGRSGARIVPVANARSGPVAAPILVDTGTELLALDPATGRDRFRSPLDHVAHAAMVGDVLVLAAMDILEAVDPMTGEVRWSRELRGASRALDAGGGQVLVLLQVSGVFVSSRLVALDAFTSEILWTRDMPNETADTLLVGVDVLAVVKRRRGERGFAMSIAVHSLLSGALVKDIPLSGETYLEPLVRLVDPRTIVTGVREAGVTRIDAWDLPAATRRFTKPLSDAQGRVTHILPVGETVVALDAAGGVRTLSLVDGSVTHETRITGGADVLTGTTPFVDDARLTILQREGAAAALTSYDRATGRAAWTQPVQIRVNSGLLLHSGDTFVVLLCPRGGRSPGALQVQLVGSADGRALGTIQNAGLAAWLPSAIVQDGTLVVAGLSGVGVYR